MSLPKMDKVPKDATIEETLKLIIVAIKKDVPSLIIYSKIIGKNTAEFTGKDLIEYGDWLDCVHSVLKEKINNEDS